MQYCVEGSSPIVKYKFGTGGYKQFKSEVSPIEVTIQSFPIPNTDNYNGEGFKVSFRVANDPNRTIELFLLDYKFEDLPPGLGYPPDAKNMRFMECGDKEFNPGAIGCLTSTLQINYSIKCPTPSNSRCAIQVFNLNKGLVFQDQGDCPVDFEVQCGNCPDGFIECQTSTYPGYCCLSCSEVKGEIIAIKNTVKSLNNG